MGYLVAAIFIVVVLGVLLVSAFNRRSKQDPELSPESEGTSYEKPQDEGPV